MTSPRSGQPSPVGTGHAPAWRTASICASVLPLDTLQSLPTDRAVDLAFIDADKESYIDYYEHLVPRLSPRGVILVDNTLWSARVVEPDDTDADTEAIRAFNAHAVTDERVIVSLLPMGDGLSVISRRRA